MATAKPFLPGASSLIEQLDTRVLVILRDGRHLLGTLRSLDQFSNLVLEDTYFKTLQPPDTAQPPLQQ